MFKKAIADLIRGIGMYRIWSYQAYHELASKFKRTALGSLWISGSMIITSLSMSLVFGALFGRDLPHVLPYIMGGIMAYNVIGYILLEAPEVFIKNTGVIVNTAFPFTFYSFEAIGVNFLNFLHNIIVFEVFLIALGVWDFPHWTIIPGMIIVLLNMFTWGHIVSMAAARFRDLRFLLPYLSSLVWFLTPIMYSVSDLQPGKAFWIEYNPFYPMVEMLRSPLLGHAMESHLWISATITSVLGCIVWFFSFSAFRRKIAFWV